MSAFASQKQSFCIALIAKQTEFEGTRIAKTERLHRAHRRPERRRVLHGRGDRGNRHVGEQLGDRRLVVRELEPDRRGEERLERVERDCGGDSFTREERSKPSPLTPYGTAKTGFMSRGSGA